MFKFKKNFHLFYLLIHSTICWRHQLSVAKDYCNETLCSTGSQQHIACDNFGDFDSSCGRHVEIIPITKKVQSIILHKLNSFRSHVAQGNLEPFKPAARMPTLYWHHELAGLAKYALRLCDNLSDPCSNTHEFQYVSFTYGDSGWMPLIMDSKSIINKILQFWFDDHQHCTMQHINGIQLAKDMLCRGYFTQIVQDRLQFIGCALMRRMSDDYSAIHYGFLCNFSRGKIQGTYVYKVSDKAALKCETGTNDVYPGLCAPMEQINANSRY